jgi:hypothetical protein
MAARRGYTAGIRQCQKQCNQGQGNGHDSEGCDSSDSDHKDKSNDGHGGTSGDKGHHGGE